MDLAVLAPEATAQEWQDLCEALEQALVVFDVDLTCPPYSGTTSRAIIWWCQNQRRAIGGQSKPRGKKELAILKLRELKSSWGEARPLPMAVKKIGVTERLTRSLRPAMLFERWQQHTSTIRPHIALGYRPKAPPSVAGPLEGKNLTKNWRHSWGQVSFMPFAHRVGFSGWHPPTPATLSHDKSSNLSCKRIGAGLLLSPQHAQASHEPDGLLRAVPLVVQHQRAASRFF